MTGGNKESRGRRGPCDRGTPPNKLKASYRIMCVEEEVKTHTRRVEAGELVRYSQVCPGCRAEERSFRLHDRRRRRFRVVIEGMVKVLPSWILRWWCTRCGKRFTDYPPFRLAAQAVCEAGGVGDVEGLSGHGRFVSQSGVGRFPMAVAASPPGPHSGGSGNSIARVGSRRCFANHAAIAANHTNVAKR